MLTNSLCSVEADPPSDYIIGTCYDLSSRCATEKPEQSVERNDGETAEKLAGKQQGVSGRRRVSSCDERPKQSPANAAV